VRSVLESNEGADCSLVVSPLNVNVCELELLLLLPEDAGELPLEEGFSKAHGTATCFPDEDPPLRLELELGELLLAPLLLDPLELESDRIAKSARPEFGLMMTSLIVPRLSPEEPCTLAPVIWLAFIS